jgi:2-oxoisovalerate dehydrogenase E2 component (dihydrolipoyl transacylase)
MSTEIKLPQLGESVHEGTIGKWLKQPGDRVAKYDPLVEVITDKVNVEMPSPVAGVLGTILVPEGQTVAVGTAIALIEDQTATSPSAAASAPESAVAPSAAASRSTAAPPEAPPLSAASPVRAAPAVADRPATAAPAKSADTPRLTPLVRRLVEEHRLTAEDLAAIEGSGGGGRITKDDVQRYVEARQSAAAAPPRPGMAGATPGPAAVQAGGADHVEALSTLRRTIADRMARSKREIPHAYGVIEVDVTTLVRHREAHKHAWQAGEGVNVSITAFIVRATARALRAVPIVNAMFTPEGILYKHAINVGVGVAIPDGLIVPVVKDADRKSVTALARELDDLAGRARRGALTLDDVSGGTFTLTNPGVFGSVFSMPIINYPQAAIMASDAIVRRPVVVGDGIAIRDIMHLGLAFDHRVFDGAVAMQFLNAVKRPLEAFAPAGDSPEF